MDIVLKLNSLPDLTMVEITKQLFNNEFLSDIQFHVDGRVLYAHSLELMKRSAVFQKQLMLNLGENKLIPVDNVIYDSFYQFIRFLYTDECNVWTTDMKIDVLKLAIKYKVIRLENTMIALLSAEPICLQLYEFCFTENYRIPYNRTKQKVADSLKVCLEDSSFETIHVDVVEEILKFDYVNKAVTEIDLLNAVIRWIKKYCEINQIALHKGHSIFDRLLQLIRFPTLDLTEFVECSLKLKTLLSDTDYGLIFKLITGHQECSVSKWNSTNRYNFSWDSELQPYDIHDESFLTKFKVKSPVLLTGIWFARGEIYSLVYKYLEKHHLQLSSINTDTRVVKVMKIQCYTSQHFRCELNCLGDFILLKPNAEYTLQIMYPGGKFAPKTVWSRCGTSEMIVNDATGSVQVESAGQNIFEMTFQVPF